MLSPVLTAPWLHMALMDIVPHFSIDYNSFLIFLTKKKERPTALLGHLLIFPSCLSLLQRANRTVDCQTDGRRRESHQNMILCL